MVALVSLVVCGSSPVCAQAPAALTKENIKKAREEAAHRQRRILFNNDGGDAVVQCPEHSIQAFLECRTSALAGTQVDTIVYCTSRGTFGRFSHKSEVGETFTSTEDRYTNNITGWLIEQGTDPLQVMIDWSRQHHVEIFWGMRVNDTHDSWGYSWEDLATSTIKKEHPEWLVGSKDNKPKVGGFKAADFTHPEIRDYTFRFVQEVCQKYDVDGVDMDFFRHPVFFKSHAWGQEVTQDERDMMTDMMRRIRAMMDEGGVKRGRPILLSVRVPDSAEYCRAIGIDIERWLKEGLVDMMVVGGYFRLNPWETSVALGHQYGVPVYPSLDETRFKDEEAKKLRSSEEGLRARAMNVWNSGADGVYAFNHFNPRASYWREIGDPKTMERLDKTYTTGARGVKQVNRWHVDGERFVNRTEVSPENPRELKKGEVAQVYLLCGEQIPKDATPRVTLSLRIAGEVDLNQVHVRFNGQTLVQGATSGVYAEYDVPSACLKRGVNTIDVELTPESGGETVLEDLALRIDYDDGTS